MTNKTKIYIGVGSLVALVGGYFIYKALRPKKPTSNGTKDKTDVKTTTTSTTTTSTSTTTPKKDEEPDNYQWKGEKKYVVTANALNLRSEPNENSQKIGKLSKGCEIKASPTSTSGWLDMNYNFYSSDKCFYDMGLTKDGSFYVSSKYLKEIK